MTQLNAATKKLSEDRLQAGFLQILPRIHAHGQVAFRGVKCPARLDDCLAEMIGLCWTWWRRLVQRGKDPSAFVSAIASYAARAVKSGRRVSGMEKTKDVLSPVAQRRRGFCVSKLPDCSTLSDNPLQDALIDNTRTPPDEQVCFRLDFPAWLASLERRNRRVAEALMVGERTSTVAQRHGLSPGRVSQLRREFKDDWQQFCGEGASITGARS
jgi:hypothetical protein